MSTVYTNTAAVAFFQAFPTIFPGTLHNDEVLNIMNDTTGQYTTGLFGTGQNQIASHLVPASAVTGTQFMALLDGTEYAAMDVNLLTAIQTQAIVGQVGIGTPAGLAWVEADFPATGSPAYPNSRANLLAASTQQGSPAMCLWGQFSPDGTYGFTLTTDQVGATGLFSG